MGKGRDRDKCEADQGEKDCVCRGSVGVIRVALCCAVSAVARHHVPSILMPVNPTPDSVLL